MTTSARSAAISGISAATRARRTSPVRSRNGPQPTWPQIVAGRKTWLPKAWSKWPWVSTTIVHRRRGQLAQVVDDLARLDVGRARVDQEDVVAAEHDPDVLVVERVATHEHAIADLGPDSHRRMVVARGPADRLLTSYLVVTKLRA